MPRSLQGYLLATYLALAVLGLGGLILWTGQRLQTIRLQQAGQELTLQAGLIAGAFREPLERLGAGDEAERVFLGDLVSFYANRTGGRVTLLDARARVLASSGGPAAAGDAGGSEVAAAEGGHVLLSMRRDRSGGAERLYVAAPIRADGGRMVAVVQLSVPAAGLYAELRRTWLGLLATGGTVLIGIAAASVLLARRIAGPIQRLTAVTEAMAAGHLESRVAPAGPEEVERLGEAFNRMAERVREMLAKQQVFAAHAAHELRSPLTALRLRLELLRAPQHPHDDVTRRYLGEMERQVGAMQQMVDHLLALSAIDEGRVPPRVALDLAPVLYEVADEVGPLARAAGLDLGVDVPPHLPPVHANAEQMRIVARNLLDNAIKYTPAPGRVSLAAGPAGDAVRVRVADTGVGIPREHLPLVFDRFYRVDGGASQRPGGSGLGLALVQAIVTTHGGTIQIESEPGQGTVCTVRLPVAPPSP